MQPIKLIPALALLCACGGSAPVAVQTPSLQCTTSGVASESWPLPEPPASKTPPIVSVTVSGDTLTFTFVDGTPPFQVLTQSDTEFAQDPTGDRVALTGTYGARIVLTGFRGDQVNYAGPKQLTSTGPRVLEVAELGDFEGTLNWGVGLQGQSCANVTASGSTLTYQFIPDE